MKAWEELLENNAKICRTRVSEYFIDMGVKIERFDKDGLIVIKNTMTHSEKFENVTPVQYKIFQEQGWTVGCCVVNIDVLKAKIEFLEYEATVESTDKEAIKRRLKKNNDKMLEYQQMLVNFEALNK